MEMAEERAEEKYDGWINEGEIAQAAEEEKICKYFVSVNQSSLCVIKGYLSHHSELYKQALLHPLKGKVKKVS